MMRRGIIATLMLAGTAVPVAAQTHLGKDWQSGLHWSVAAPQGATWALECRFQPVTYEASPYDLRHWSNRIRTSGTGADRGRLPGQDGRCALTKTGGAGPVGIALVKGGVATAQGTNDPARPAVVTVF